MSKEEENYFSICLLFLEVATPLLAQFLNCCLTKRNQNLQSFINNNQHKLYHLCFTSTRCCKCSSGGIYVPRRCLTVDQLKLLFDYSNPTTAIHDQFCCAIAKPGISTKDLDASFINVLLLNFFTDAFWDFLQNRDFESFLNSNRHLIFHLCENTKCCMCKDGNALCPKTHKLNQRSLNKIYDLNRSKCQTCSETANGLSMSPCTMKAKQNISKECLDDKEISIFQECFSPVRIGIAAIIDIRNTNICHVTNAFMSDANFTSVEGQIERAMLDVADACGTRQLTETLIQQTLGRRFDRELLQRCLTVIQDHNDRDTNLEKILLDLTDTVTSRFDDQRSIMQNVDDKVDLAERNADFYRIYMFDPSLFIHDQILTLNKTDIKHLCEDGANFKIIPAAYLSSTVFMSTLEARWIRHNEETEKFSKFRFTMLKDNDGEKHFFHIKSADLPNYYLTMGFRGWWVRAIMCNGQLINDATWDIRCLKTRDGKGNILSKYLLVPKNSTYFVCVDWFGRLYGGNGFLHTSNMFIFKRVRK